MLSPASWQHYADAVPEGQKRRFDHDCGGGRTLLVARESSGVSAFCFRCNDKGWMPPPVEPWGVRLARLAAGRKADDVLQSIRGLPEPAIYDVDRWPVDGRLWLLRHGIGRVEAADLGVFFHEPTRRLVLPVMRDGRPVFWQARSTDGREPKYLAPEVTRGAVVPQYGKADQIVLTEDILSAYKVGLVSEGWSLMGTALGEGHVAQLLARNLPVVMWLDGDAAGDKGSTKGIPLLRSVGLKVRRVRTPLDPKAYSREQIKEILA